MTSTYSTGVILVPKKFMVGSSALKFLSSRRSIESEASTEYLPMMRLHRFSRGGSDADGGVVGDVD